MHKDNPYTPPEGDASFATVLKNPQLASDSVRMGTLLSRSARLGSLALTSLGLFLIVLLLSIYVLSLPRQLVSIHSFGVPRVFLDASIFCLATIQTWAGIRSFSHRLPFVGALAVVALTTLTFDSRVALMSSFSIASVGILLYSRYHREQPRASFERTADELLHSPECGSHGFSNGQSSRRIR
jgi:hypothetical protein